LLRGYLQSGLSHKFLISVASHPDTLHYESRNVEIPGNFFKPKEVRKQKRFGNADANYMATGLRAVTHGD